jgi:L-threonylcarbamoyladenylate synthase
MTRVLAADPVSPSPPILGAALAVLRNGGLVAFPTETFYGLGAAALDPAEVRRIFEVKVLVDSVAMVEALALEIPAAARALMACYWPGPLTLVLRARPHVPDEVTAGSATVGVRLSAHPLARALVGALGQPITAPSANPDGLTPPTTAAAVLAYFRGRIELVLDAGATAGGQPSTVLDVTVDPPRVLRAGAVRVP